MNCLFDEMKRYIVVPFVLDSQTRVSYGFVFVYTSDVVIGILLDPMPVLDFILYLVHFTICTLQKSGEQSSCQKVLQEALSVSHERRICSVEY